MIAALFVESGGCYFGLPEVDPWDVARDAKKYQGPFPVVAHPPCQRWGRFSDGSPMKKGYGTGNDDGCFESALASVRKFGGVLEHPADSKAWPEFGLLKPAKVGWLPSSPGEWVCQVEQGHYGHPARKRTWLLVAGERPFELIWGPAPQRLPPNLLAQKGYEAARRRGIVSNQSHNQRQRTPIEFRDLLITIARR